MNKLLTNTLKYKGTGRYGLDYSRQESGTRCRAGQVCRLGVCDQNGESVTVCEAMAYPEENAKAHSDQICGIPNYLRSPRLPSP
eukprot:1748081-Amphidinium_carterae.1